MGSAVSTGTDNDDLIDNLMEAEYIKTSKVEQVFRAVDRAFYYLPEYRENAYRDLAWKNGNIHLSAPCVYCEVMESLQLEPGLSFLNVGSGTGYFNTMVGLILGPNGTNHGIEMFEEVVQYANMKLDEFKRTSSAIDSFDFCEPKFVKGNGFCLPSGCRQYDRVYCGAACPETHDTYVRNLIKVGGILVMPFNHHLLQVRRISETQWQTNIVLPVSFATLRMPDSIEAKLTVSLPDQEPMTLQEVCRFAIRRLLRAGAEHQYPELSSRRTRSPCHLSAKRRKRHLQRKQQQMIAANICESSDDDSGDHYGFCATRSPNSLQQLMARSSRNEMPLLQEEDDNEDEEEDEDEGLEEEVEGEEEEGEKDGRKENAVNKEDGDDGTASQSSITEQRRKVAKREKFDSGLGDEMENGKGLTSEEEEEEEEDSDGSSLGVTEEEGSIITAIVMARHYSRTRQAAARGRTVHDVTTNTSSQNPIDDVASVEQVTSSEKPIDDVAREGHMTSSNTKMETDDDGVTYGRVMRNSIMQLPLPYTLKSYLNFCREF